MLSPGHIYLAVTIGFLLIALAVTLPVAVRAIRDGLDRERRDDREREGPVDERRRTDAGAVGDHDDGTRPRCRHCGTRNDPAFTYCRHCIEQL